ncbi:hypothetical protein A2368_02325 [Candidatus Collierbacteria bacterium RIFOXYB1_FULL_49_13]|uniref:Uncharacterized protein n=1 Tax=Candidatus Collierbacteria bacterium RIFOXYB1_FULL_49_13 TaxID=1817728 RepID=A0A1F5FJ04_9BACT|nr:MAG: hypothetical protein A2368_02325 [Candidatus Collierbacteria bacterium RIFOXYB1_FULL_49_13]
MSGFQAFMLGVFAIVDTLLVLRTGSIRKAMDGKTESQVHAAAKRAFEENDLARLAQGVGGGCVVLLALIFTYMIEPIAALTALTGDLGNQAFAGLALAITVVAGASFVFDSRKRLKKLAETKRNMKVAIDGDEVREGKYEGGFIVAGEKVKIKTIEGEVIEGILIKEDEVYTFGNPTVRKLRDVFFAIPTVFLWYLLVVVITG